MELCVFIMKNYLIIIIFIIIIIIVIIIMLLYYEEMKETLYVGIQRSGVSL